MGLHLQGAILRWLARAFVPLYQASMALRAQVDLIEFQGPIFQGLDNRLAALRLVQNGLCDAALFDSAGGAPAHCAPRQRLAACGRLCTGAWRIPRVQALLLLLVRCARCVHTQGAARSPQASSRRRARRRALPGPDGLAAQDERASDAGELPDPRQKADGCS